MKNSLSDQLLNLGLTNKQKVQQARTAKKKQQKKSKTNLPDHQNDNLKSQIDQAREDKVARDRELNRQREAEKQRRAIEAQIRQLIEQHAQTIPKDAELPYQFAHQRKIKKLYINEQLQNQLLKGWLAIAFLEEGRYFLVPDAIAARIEQRDADRVIRIEQEELSDDDPYKDYPIPDDLMW
ncbi:DUF2058 domain-containing protein [Motiliproteus sediminis]|uniref:DUF2058 domain-containing protein n=1 Tax=Motiliproteus sediminis TaxID=1468178 RepID=UPI001AEFC572|nr:DUF2058 domain-containing protein [Motiliproteus sediminis]